MIHGSSSHTHSNTTPSHLLIYLQFTDRTDRQIYIEAYAFSRLTLNSKEEISSINISQKNYLLHFLQAKLKGEGDFIVGSLFVYSIVHSMSYMLITTHIKQN